MFVKHDMSQAPDTREKSGHDPGFRYARVHLPTRKVSHEHQKFAGRSLFLEALNRWNRLGATYRDGPLWMYFEDPL